MSNKRTNENTKDDPQAKKSRHNPPCEARDGALCIPRTEAHSSRQADHFYQLRTESQWTDVTIHSQGTTFQCHRVILATSPVLKAMMLADMTESSEGKVTLDDIPPTVLELLINYIYTGEARVPDDQLSSVIKAADFLQVLELRNYCLHRAVSVLAPSNVISWYKLADQLSADELKYKCSEMLASSLPDVCKESEFLELSMEEMSSYMCDVQNIKVHCDCEDCRDDQNTEVDCDDLLEATLDWVDYKANLRQNHVMNLVQKINLSRCSIQCIEEKVEKHASLFRSQPDALMTLTKGIAAVANQSIVRRKQRNRKCKTLSVIGGHLSSDVANKTFWCLDPNMNFVDLCQLQDCAAGQSVCVTPDGFVVTGGEDSDLCMMFVSSTRSWKKLKCLKMKRSRHASVFRNGRIYVVGGLVSGEDSFSVQSLDLNSEEWNNEEDLPDGTADLEVVCMDGDIFLLNANTGEIARLDMNAQCWRLQSFRPGGRCIGARMVAANGQLMIVGGHKKLFECYHSRSKVWAKLAKPFLVHNRAALAFHEEKLYLIGGERENRVEEYNFKSQSWTVCDYTVPEKLEGLHAVLLDI